MGQAPTFKLVLANVTGGMKSRLTLNQCMGSKLSLDFKNEDWTIPEFDFSAFADAANNVGVFSVDAA